MSEFKTIEVSTERKTYLKGRFKGKYWALLDPERSDGRRENFYDIEIYEGEIYVRSENLKRWIEGGEFDEYVNTELFITKIPAPIQCNILYPDKTIKHYKIELCNTKLSDFALYNQLHEGPKVFGTIEGDICGYFKHFDVENVEVEVLDEEADPEIIDSTATNYDDLPEVGYKEWNGKDYYREVIRNYKTGNKEWSTWTDNRLTNNGKSSGIMSTIWSIVGFAYFGFIGFVLLAAAWKILLPLAGIWLFFFVLSAMPTIVSRISQWGLGILSIGFGVYMLLGLFSLFKNPIPSIKRPKAENRPEEIKRPETDPEYIDSVISNRRIWKDYRDTTYSAWIDIFRSDLNASKYNRLNLPYKLSSDYEYNNVVNSISQFDLSRLSRVFQTFDSLRLKNHLDDKLFAEMLVSYVQDIPYVLVLDNNCDANLYNDPFIANYLQEGKECEGRVKYGLFTPVEFSAHLKGDCDTRTLLLYTLLAHYKYDVAMLGSDTYKHSVIGINLPYSGVSKIIQSKRYVLWETTAIGMKPGDIPVTISNPDNWQVNLLSKPLTL